MRLVLVLAALTVGASATNCSCATMYWATCNENPCSCFLLVGDDDNQMLNCSTLIPKCIMKKAEIHRARTSVDLHALDNAGLFKPECEDDGKFKAKQCKNTEECWCVNSAGSRRTAVKDQNLKCEELVEIETARLALTLKQVTGKVDENELKILKDAFQKRYSFIKDVGKMLDFGYYQEDHQIVIDVKKSEGDADVNALAYYIERDVAGLPLFKGQEKFELFVGSRKLKVENINTYYVDEKPPTFPTTISTGRIVGIVVVVVAFIGVCLIYYWEEVKKAIQWIQIPDRYVLGEQTPPIVPSL